MQTDISDIPAVLLVGGMGTRLRSVVASTPKPLASVGGNPFLELLVRQLRSQGIRRLVMCSGYLAEQIESVFGDGSAWDVAIEYSREEQPLGTAGAVRQSRPYLQQAIDFIVMNGDSFIEVDLRQLVDFHRSQKALASMVTVKVEDAGRYGTVQVDHNGAVMGFQEKTEAAAPGLINAGVYMFAQNVFTHIPDSPASLERDVFPGIVHRGLYAQETSGLFIDIGTPDDYARAQVLCEQLSAAAHRR